MHKKTIRLVIFNEEYWGKGLIYSQNILPLEAIAKSINSNIELLSFTAIPMMIKKRKEIAETRIMLKKKGITLRNYPILYYPTRYMLPQWYLLPYFFLNIFFYVLWIRLRDRNLNVVYDLRSYQPALAFWILYGNTHRLVFDPRTDFVEENINAGHFKKNGLTTWFWNKTERKIVEKFRYTIVISDIFKNNLIRKHALKSDKKIVVVYNPIDYGHFQVERKAHDGLNFLYTGSLGGWNRLENYIGVFKAFYDKYPSSRFYICTNATPDKVEPILQSVQYKHLSNAIKVYYNVSYNDLPAIYAKCDFGFQIMNKRDSRVGVKYIEYIAAGVIPIINLNVEGAKFLSDKYQIGVVINDNENVDKLCKAILNANKIDKNSSEYKEFKYLTDTATISERISHIYC